MNLIDNDLILPASQHQWIQERATIHCRLRDWCDKNSINFKISDIDIKAINESDNNRILFVYLFDLIKSHQDYQIIDEICQRQGKKIWVVTDNVIDPQVHVYRNIKICSYHELLGMTALSSFNPSKHNPSKLFNCFIQRVEAVRQSWFYFLYLHDLLDQGYVTFLLHQKNEFSTLRGRQLFDYVHHNFGLQSLEKFRRAYDDLKSLVPFRNITEDKDLVWYIGDSKYSVILETYAVDDGHGSWCWTEKIMRSIQTPTINLPFTQKYSIARLRELGLEFDDFVDEIDCLDWQQRQQSLLQILTEDAIIRDVSHITSLSEHNFSMINQWKKSYQRHDFFDQLFAEIISA